MTGLTVLGIDPGTAICGYGIIRFEGSRILPVAYGAITSGADRPMPERLKHIFSELTNIIDQYVPDLVAVESLFFNKNVKTALTVGQARGVILLCAAIANRAVVEYTPLQVKQAVVGYGNADKEQVAYMVMRLLGIRQQPKPDDVTDALAVAICAAHSYRI